MRLSRTFLRAEGNHFHVVSRIVGRAFLLGEKEKAVFHRIMRRLEKASGVQVLTYCLMDNHVHLLLRTEQIEGEAISDGELVRRVRGIYSRELADELAWRLQQGRKEGRKKGAAGGGSGMHGGMHGYWRERYLARLGNLSEFMRVLKATFSKWYNKEHERTGTLWEDRYKVVLVEGSEAVLRKVAAYIDLNPVRAGMVEDAGTYGWSGYGEATAGGVEARRGITRVMGVSPQRGWRDAGPGYGGLLSYAGLERTPGAKVETVRDSRGRRLGRRVVASGSSGRGAKAETETTTKPETESDKGKEDSNRSDRSDRSGENPSFRDLVDERVRYFIDGAVIGSRAFVEQIFQAQSEERKGKRKTGARKMRGGDWADGGDGGDGGEEEGGLYVLRDLRKDVIGGSRQS